MERAPNAVGGVVRQAVFVYCVLYARAGGPAGQVGRVRRRAARRAGAARHLPLVTATRRDRQQRARPPVLQGALPLPLPTRHSPTPTPTPASLTFSVNIFSGSGLLTTALI